VAQLRWPAERTELLPPGMLLRLPLKCQACPGVMLASND
jgi:hypothetical protein